MRTLVLGGIRSGKSAWAESVMAETAAVRYVATGPTGGGQSWENRLAAHRHRRPAHWTTVESSDVAALLRTDQSAPTLVDDLGCWLTALLDRRGWAEEPLDPDVDALAGAIAEFPAPLVLVSPEVGLGVVPATAAGCRFADELGRLNRVLADICEQVVLVVAGQPVWVKR